GDEALDGDVHPALSWYGRRVARYIEEPVKGYTESVAPQRDAGRAGLGVPQGHLEQLETHHDARRAGGLVETGEPSGRALERVGNRPRRRQLARVQRHEQA